MVTILRAMVHEHRQRASGRRRPSSWFASQLRAPSASPMPSASAPSVQKRSFYHSSQQDDLLVAASSRIGMARKLILDEIFAPPSRRRSVRPLLSSRHERQMAVRAECRPHLVDAFTPPWAPSASSRPLIGAKCRAFFGVHPATSRGPQDAHRQRQRIEHPQPAAKRVPSSRT